MKIYKKSLLSPHHEEAQRADVTIKKSSTSMSFPGFLRQLALHISLTLGRVMQWPYLFAPLLNLLYPPVCIACQTNCFDANLLCEECWVKITFITRPYCQKCGTSLSNNRRISLCTETQCFNEKHFYHSTKSLIEYNDAAKDLIVQFKFHSNFELLRLFKNWFRGLLDQREYQEIDYVFPVPLHKNKLRARGYNQTAVLAKIVSRIIKKQYHDAVLIKVKNTINQSDLKQKARKKNLTNAFDINRKNSSIINNKRVLLIDDIITTGATVNECSKVLLKNGAQEVRILSIARR